MDITKICFDNENVFVSFDNGEFIVNKLDNAWLWVIGAIHDDTNIVIKDNRKELQDHQYNLSCTKEKGGMVLVPMPGADKLETLL